MKTKKKFNKVSFLILVILSIGLMGITNFSVTMAQDGDGDGDGGGGGTGGTGGTGGAGGTGGTSGTGGTGGTGGETGSGSVSGFGDSAVGSGFGSVADAVAAAAEVGSTAPGINSAPDGSFGFGPTADPGGGGDPFYYTGGGGGIIPIIPINGSRCGAILDQCSQGTFENLSYWTDSENAHRWACGEDVAVTPTCTTNDGDGNCIGWTSGTERQYGFCELPRTWTAYCTGPSDPNGNHWQWWEYDDSIPANWRFIRNGDGTCTPPPVGNHDSATCSLDAGTLTGWLCDADDYNVSLEYHVYRDGPAGSGTFVGSGSANVNRPDVAAAGVCGGTGNHGFEFSIPWDLRQSGANHTYYIHAIDYSPYGFSGNPLLTNTPKSVTCPLPPPPTKIDDGLCEYDFTDNRLEGRFSWGAPSGYDTFYVRADRTAVGRWPSDWNDENFVGTNYEITGLTGGATYYWWVHTKYTPSGISSNPPIQGQFTCPLPPEVTVEARYESATTGSGPWTRGSLALKPGENVTLQWSTLRATACEVIAGPGLSVGGATAGTDAVDRPNPGDTYNYHIRCRGPGGYGDGYIAVSTDVIPVTRTLQAKPAIVPQGETTDLDWAITTTYPLVCSITGGGTNESLPLVTAPGRNGSVTTAPVPNTTNYLLSCLPEGYTGPTYTANARVEVIPRGEER